MTDHLIREHRTVWAQIRVDVDIWGHSLAPTWTAHTCTLALGQQVWPLSPSRDAHWDRVASHLLG